MGLQKYRADKEGATCPNGSIPFYSSWQFGPSLALIRNVPINVEGVTSRTVYVQGEADTFFTIPGAIKLFGHTVRGIVTSNEDGYQFTVTKGDNE